MKLPRAELLEVTRRVSQLAQRNAALRLSFSEGELVVSAETPDLGDAREALPAPYSGELLEIGFNPEFVRDGLESIDADEVVAEADLAAAAGAARAGGRRRLQLPRDADSPQRLGGAAVIAALECRGLPQPRRRARRARRGHRRPARAERRRQDEPARGRLLRPRSTAPSARGPDRDLIRFERALGPGRARAATASEGDAARRRSTATASGATASTAARCPRPRPSGRWSASSTPTACSWSRARRRTGAPTWTGWSRRCGRRARTCAAAFGRTLAQRNALVSRVKAGLADRRLARRPGTSGSRPRPSR